MTTPRTPLRPRKTLSAALVGLGSMATLRWLLPYTVAATFAGLAAVGCLIAVIVWAKRSLSGGAELGPPVGEPQHASAHGHGYAYTRAREEAPNAARR